MEETEIQKKEREAMRFFKDAFCAESARLLRPNETENLEPYGFIEIETGDNRGTIYIATCRPINKQSLKG